MKATFPSRATRGKVRYARLGGELLEGGNILEPNTRGRTSLDKAELLKLDEEVAQRLDAHAEKVGDKPARTLVAHQLRISTLVRIDARQADQERRDTLKR